MRQEISSPTPKTERVVSRVAPASKIILEQAAALSGYTSLNQFVVQSALREAKRVIEDNQQITLTAEDTTAFLNALDNPPEPNKALLEAIKLHSDNMEMGR
jgi:uncharacterized protein (DUF1778 family)